MSRKTFLICSCLPSFIRLLDKRRALRCEPRGQSDRDHRIRAVVLDAVNLRDAMQPREQFALLRRQAQLAGDGTGAGKFPHLFQQRRDAFAGVDGDEERPRKMAAQPMKLRIETVRNSTTITALARDWNSPVPVGTLALINAVAPTASIPAGSLVKRVTGEAIR